MAVQNIPRKVGPTTGNGILKEFPFSFKTVRASDVVVKTSSGTSVTDEEVTLRYGTDYTVTLNSNQDERAGGSVVFVDAPAKGVRVAITSDTAIDQQLVLTNHDGFLPESLNGAYDKLTIICQELKETLSRCLIVPVTSEKTPQEVMSDLLEVANRAADYAQRAEAIYNEVVSTGQNVSATWQEIQETKALIDIHKAAIDAAVARAEEILERNEVIGQEVEVLLPHLPDLQVSALHIDEIHRVGSDLRGFETDTLDLGSITDTHIDGETRVTEGYIKKVADHIDDCIHPVASAVDDIHAVAQVADSVAELAPHTTAIESLVQYSEHLEGAAQAATSLEETRAIVTEATASAVQAAESAQSNAQSVSAWAEQVEVHAREVEQNTLTAEAARVSAQDACEKAQASETRLSAATESAISQITTAKTDAISVSQAAQDLIASKAEVLARAVEDAQATVQSASEQTAAAAEKIQEVETANITMEVQMVPDGTAASVQRTGSAMSPNFILTIPQGPQGPKGDTPDWPELVDLGGLS